MSRSQGNQAAWKQHTGPSGVGGPFDGSQNSELSGFDTAVFDPNAQAANIGQNLPLAAGSVGRTITYVNGSTAGAFTLGVTAQGGDTLNDPAGVAGALGNGSSVTIQAINSTTWQVVGSG